MAQRKNSSGESAMTPKQKQAALVLGICVMVFVLTVSVVAVLVSRSRSGDNVDEGGDSSVSSGSSTVAEPSFDAGKYGDTILGKTEDAGKQYLEETIFVGDSNTHLYYQNGLMDLDHVLAVDGLGIQNFASDKSIYFKKDETAYSIPEALAKMKPRRVIMMMGTNNIDGTMSAESFVKSYGEAVDAIQSAYSYADLIVAAVPPIPKEHSSYSNVSMDVVNEFNEALAQMCSDKNLKFLNISEVLMGSDGFGKASSFRPNDIHMKKDGLLAIMDYARTHAYEGTEDRRPDTSNIPTRRTGTAGSSGASSNTKPEATQKPEKEEDNKTFTAQYNVDKNVGGTLESGDQKKVTSLSFKDLKKDSSLTVTAVPADGYEFVKWSDGKTEASRTDKSFKQNLNVTAMFSTKMGIKIKEGSSGTIKLGETMYFHAEPSGMKKGMENSTDWTMDGKEIRRGYSCGVTPEKEGTYTIKATIVGENGKTYVAEYKLTVETAPTPSPTPVPHEHNYKVESETAATCTEAGKKILKCECGDRKEESIPALGHDYDEGKVTTAATCIKDGEKTYTCKRCGATKTEPIKATGHTAGEWEITLQPQVGVPGEKVQKCTVCGEIINREPIDALPSPEGDDQQND